MIRIQRVFHRDGLTLTAEGHAGYAPSGQDIVCAGVSALLYGYVAYLEGLSSIATAEAASEGGGGGCDETHLAVEESDGRLWVRTRGLGGLDLRGFAVTEAGLRLIAAAYPGYVTYCGGMD